jgi:hypothetical protein
MTTIDHYADKKCWLCGGTGEVPVRRDPTGMVKALCSCTRSIHRAITADTIARARRLTK